MKILFLTQILPYPPDAGPRIKTWHLLRYLAEKGHTIYLASFLRPDEEPYIETVRHLCHKLYTVPISRSRFSDIKYFLKSNLTGRPFLIERDDLQSMRNLVQKILVENHVDVIHADQITMTQFALKGNENANLNLHKYTRLFDAHNATWTIVDRMRNTSPWYLQPVLSLETRRVKKYEGVVVKEFDHTFTVTEIDRQALLDTMGTAYKEKYQENISVIPIAVDTSQYLPIRRIRESLNILTLGTLHYLPNADGIRWFMRQVFPLVTSQIPKATLTVVGKNPPQDFLQMAANNHNITVTGYVPDLEPYYECSAVVVVPVRAGGGMRVRILEAFSRGMPVITTTVGLEGIDATPGDVVLVEDQEEKFAEAVIRVLKNDQFQDELGMKARKFVEKNYDWRIVFNKLDNIYGSEIG